MIEQENGLSAPENPGHGVNRRAGAVNAGKTIQDFMPHATVLSGDKRKKKG